jgi:hypothetical protein
MGQTEGIDMQFNLPSLLCKVDGLDALTIPIEKQEMDDVTKAMPSDRAGPDGFNG